MRERFASSFRFCHRGWRISGLTAIDLADDAVQGLARQAGEIIAMQRDASPAESDRLQTRIAALGPEDPNETAQRAEMRGLLQHELDLIWRMRDRLERASERRERQFNGLRHLYATLSESCDERTDSTAPPEMTANAVNACAELRRELELADA